MIHGTKGDLVKLLILMKLIILDICLSIKPQSLDNKPNTSSNYGFLETIAINEVTINANFCRFSEQIFLFEYVIMELGLIGNKYKQHSIKNKSYFNEIKRMGAGPHPSAPHVTKEL